MTSIVQNSVSSYASLKQQVRETLLLGQRRIEQEKLKTYWQTGRLIEEHILQHKDRAGYGEEVIERLSKDLGVSKSSFYETLRFARTFPIFHARGKLTWAHYRKLATVSDFKARQKLLAQAEKSEWTSRELEIRVSQVNALESDPTAKPALLSSPKIGPFWTYRVLDSETIHVKGKDTLWIDLGFRTFLEAERFLSDGANHKRRAMALGRLASTGEARKIKAGDVITSTKDKDGVYTLSREGEADPSSLYTYKAYIERAIDGDTIKVQIDLGFSVWTRQTLRLRGIDAFEIDTKEGRRAKSFVERELKNEPFVTIKTTRSDKYDRFLADIFYGKGEYLNQKLLDEKLAVTARS